MIFDCDKVYKDVFIFVDGKVFMNIFDVLSSSCLYKYKGIFCLKGICYFGRYYYVIKLDIKVIKFLDKSNFVYELGIVRKFVIGKNLVVEGEKFVWLMIGVYYVDCDVICLYIVYNNYLFYYEVLIKNEIGSIMERVFGFFLDIEFG